MVKNFPNYPCIHTVRCLSGRKIHLKNNSVELRVGDKVMRSVVDGDFMLVNRQPTLTKSSIMIHKVIVNLDRKFHSIGVNSMVLKAYAGDCDGDEINIYCPLENRIGDGGHVYNNMRSDKDGAIAMNMHCDLLLGIYNLSRHK